MAFAGLLIGVAVAPAAAHNPPSFPGRTTQFTSTSAVLAKVGDQTTVTIAATELPAGVNVGQWYIGHTSEFSVSTPTCTGLFAGAIAAFRTPQPAGTALVCGILGSISAPSGPVVSFVLTRLTPCQGTSVISLRVDGTGATRYVAAGSSVLPGTFNSLVVGCAAPVTAPFTRFSPETINLADIGSFATITISAGGLPVGLTVASLDVQYDPAVIRVSDPVCRGIFAGGSASGGHSAHPNFDCHVSATALSFGDVMTLTVTRVGRGGTTVTLGSGTQYEYPDHRQFNQISPGTTNTLTITDTPLVNLCAADRERCPNLGVQHKGLPAELAPIPDQPLTITVVVTNERQRARSRSTERGQQESYARDEDDDIDDQDDDEGDDNDSRRAKVARGTRLLQVTLPAIPLLDSSGKNGLRYSAYTSPRDYSCTAPALEVWVITCSAVRNDTIPPGGSRNFTFTIVPITSPNLTLQANGSPQSLAQLSAVSRAVVDPDGVLKERDESDNTSSQATVLRAPLLSTGRAGCHGRFGGGQDWGCVERISNAGSGPAHLPAGISVIRFDIDGGGIDGLTSFIAPPGIACQPPPFVLGGRFIFDCKTTQPITIPAGGKVDIDFTLRLLFHPQLGGTEGRRVDVGVRFVAPPPTIVNFGLLFGSDAVGGLIDFCC